MKEIQYIQQPTEYLCGQACVAMIGTLDLGCGYALTSLFTSELVVQSANPNAIPRHNIIDSTLLSKPVIVSPENISLIELVKASPGTKGICIIYN